MRHVSFWLGLFWPAAIVQCASIVGMMIVIVIGPQLLSLVYGKQFESQGHTLLVATIVAGPLYCSIIFMNGCYVTQMRRWILAIQSLALLVVVAATLILVPR